MHAYDASPSAPRLAGGIALIPAMVGAFGVSELLISMGLGQPAPRPLPPNTPRSAPMSATSGGAG